MQPSQPKATDTPPTPLPTRSPRDRAPLQPGLDAGALAGARIVVVDDDEDNVVLLCRVLRRAGYGSVTGFTDPLRALTALAEAPADLLLLDLHMPAVDGFAVLERLAGQTAGPVGLPVLVLTADPTQEARHRALAAGARDFVVKPFDLVEVLLRVRSALDVRDAQRRLIRQNQALELADRRRLADLSRIAADLAHELRTPLYAIQGLTEVLLELERDVPETLKADLRRIEEVVGEALQVVDRQIAVARDAGGRRPDALGLVRVEDLFAGVLRALGPLADAQHIRLRAETADGIPALESDPVRLGQVLRNLVANAIQHTRHGEVALSARLLAGEEHVALAVSDTGTGIHPDDLERIFRPFERVGATGEGAGGLGLPLTRQLCQELGGDVAVESRLGEGSTFTATVACRGRSRPPVAAVG